MSYSEPPPPPSDSGDGTPPPPYQQPMPPAPGAPPPYAQAPPPYAGAAGGPAPKPPRPNVQLGAILTIVGSLISIVAVFLPWVSSDGESQNGTGVFLASDFTLYDNPGSGVIVFAVITGGLGIALYFAGRVLAVAIIAIVAAAIAFFIGIGMVSIASDTADFSSGSLGFGAVLQPIAPLITLAGAIVATSKRRRWPTAG